MGKDSNHRFRSGLVKTIPTITSAVVLLRDRDSSAGRVASFIASLGFQRVDGVRLEEVNQGVRGLLRFRGNWDESVAFSDLAKSAHLLLETTPCPLLDDPDLGEVLPFWLRILPECRVIVCCNDPRSTLWIGLAHLGQRSALFLEARGDQRECQRIRKFLHNAAGSKNSRFALQAALDRLSHPPSPVFLRLMHLLRPEVWHGLLARLGELEQKFRAARKRANTAPSTTFLSLRDLPSSFASSRGDPAQLVHWIETEPRPGLFMHPPGQAVFQLRACAGMRFVASVNLRSDCWSHRRDTVYFRVSASLAKSPNSGISATSWVNPGRLFWHRKGRFISLDLSEFANQDVHLSLQTIQVQEDGSWPWAVWNNAGLRYPGSFEPTVSYRNVAKTRLDAFLAGTETRLAFPKCEQPVVSVVIWTDNCRLPEGGCDRCLPPGGGTEGGCEKLLVCLESLVLYADVPLEVIVVDDGSDEFRSRLLAKIGSIICLRSQSGLERTNAAREARGQFLLLMSSDTQIAPGCLSALVSTLESRPDGGAVGGRLMSRDGSLQEAGSIVWRDGTLEAYGRGDDPAKPEYNYFREVDFCSGALLLIRRALFQGFDARYRSTSYEDADLCFALRKASSRVFFQPLAVGFRDGNRVEILSLQNRDKFVHKWSQQLPEQALNGEVLQGRDRRLGPRVLLLEDAIPHPTLGAGLPRSYNILEFLTQQGAAVTLLPVLDLETPQPTTREFQQRGVEIFYPRDPEQTAENLVERMLQRPGSYSAVCISRPHNAMRYRRRLRARFPEARLIYDAESLFCLRDIQAAEVARRPLSSLDQAALVENEVGPLGNFDLVMAVSRLERNRIRFRHPQLRVALIGHQAVPRRNVPSFNERADLLFVGSLGNDSSPNVDAIGTFVARIFPVIRARLPGCRLVIAGSSPSPLVQQLESDCVQITGTVEKLAPVHARCRIFIAPVRFCSGILIKVIEALAEGVPVVATVAACAGLALEHGKNALVCSSEEEFAAAVVELYGSPKLWEKLQLGGWKYVQDHCNPKTIQQGLAQVFRLPPADWPGSKPTAGPLVSICIPTYQGASYVAAALQSALTQSYPNIEILVSDDGSTDATVAIAETLFETCQLPCRVLRGPSQGMVANWNHLVEKANGEFIKFLFQDDWLETRCVEKLMEGAKLDAKIGMVFSPRAIELDPAASNDRRCQQIFGYCGDLHLLWSDLESVQDGRALLSDPFLFRGSLNKIGEPTTVLLRASTLREVGPFDADMGQLVDLDFWFRVAAVSQVAFVNETLSGFRVHLQQVSRLSNRIPLDMAKFYRKTIDSELFGIFHPIAQDDLRALLAQADQE